MHRNPPLLPLALLSLILAASPSRVSAVATDGALDPTFDPQPDLSVLTMPSHPDTRLVLGGLFQEIAGIPHRNLARVAADGSLDSGFHADADAVVTAAAVLADGAVVVGGEFKAINGLGFQRLARLGPDGAPDPSFHPDFNGIVWALAVERGGSLLVAGEFTWVNGEERAHLVRLLPDGSVDPGFHPNPDQRVLSLAIQSDGRILACGDFGHIGGEPRTYLARLSPDGSVDPGFHAAPDSVLRAVAVQADGRILIGGHFARVDGQPRAKLARLREDGSLDPDFQGPGADSIVQNLCLQTDGRIIASGYFHTIQGGIQPHLARLNPDGSLDPGFAPAPDDWVWSCFLQADGRVLVAGGFHTISGTPRDWIARLANGPATQVLSVPDPTRVVWERGGTSPETHEVSFEQSVDGTTWTLLGHGTRIAGGWELTGLALPATGSVRARARICGGHLNGSSGLVEAVAPFAFLQPGPLIRNGGFEDGLAAWSTSGNTSVQTAPPYTATDGSGCACFNDRNLTPDGVLEQTFPTLPGREYLLEFDLGTLAWNRDLQQLGVALEGSVTLAAQTLSISGPGNGRTAWTSARLPFTADRATTTLVFRDLSPATRSIDLLLDRVRVIPVEARLAIEGSPAEGVAVSVSPNDLEGRGDGTTRFERRYTPDTPVTLTAPADSGGLGFSHWLLDGVPFTDDRSLSMTLDGDHQATAVFVGGPPRILASPQDAAVLPGGDVAFAVTAQGTTPLAYVWRHDGVPIADAHGSELRIHDVRPEHVGAYEVTVSNPFGTVTAGPAQLTLLPDFAGLQNGSFEQGLDAWSTSGHLASLEPPPRTATAGTRVLAFNSGNLSPDGVATQCFATTPGQTYTLAFDLGVWAYTTAMQKLEVEIVSGADRRVQSFTIRGSAGGAIRWMPCAIDFTAGDATTCVAFRDRSPTSQAIDLLVDQVRVVPQLTLRLANSGFESGAEAWTVEGHAEARGGAPYRPAEGAWLMAFNTANAAPDGRIEQAFTTVPGGSYRVRFKLGTLAYNTSPQQLEVEVLGTTTLVRQGFVVRGIGGGKTDWQERSLTFTADGTTSTLRFRDRSATSAAIDLLLDEVVVE